MKILKHLLLIALCMASSAMHAAGPGDEPDSMQPVNSGQDREPYSATAPVPAGVSSDAAFYASVISGRNLIKIIYDSNDGSQRAFSFYDAQGKILFVTELTSEPGFNSFTADLEKLPVGLYWVTSGTGSGFRKSIFVKD